ncbi:hypothetical protein CLV98_102519 [Dyadobacter jejuensis]|uniref:Uncharacterized protein n=1 Tax=Dyadobacter jejuensis TaxID=1082580 RepID=A0A316AR42_9BACT|nr:hypothetical protein CLV98_102519 [Dyadobacter jejuensis]
MTGRLWLFLTSLRNPERGGIFIATNDTSEKQSPSGATSGLSAVGLLVLDATEASPTSTDTLILAAYPDRFIGIDDNKFVFLQYVLKNYCYYSNLI